MLSTENIVRYMLYVAIFLLSYGVGYNSGYNRGFDWAEKITKENYEKSIRNNANVDG